MVGGLLAYGISHYTDGIIYPWQLLFMILGLATVLWAGVISIHLPDSPMSAKCFNEDDKRLLIERVRHNETGIQNKQYKRYQAVEALLDPFVWCIVMLIVTANLVIGGLGVFSNLIISQFGFSLLQTNLLNIAQGALTIIVMIGGAQVSQKWGQTCFTMLVWSNGPRIFQDFDVWTGANSALAMVRSPSHRDWNHHWHTANFYQRSRLVDRFLLYTILPCTRQHGNFTDLPKHCRTNQEVDLPHNDIRR